MEVMFLGLAGMFPFLLFVLRKARNANSRPTHPSELDLVLFLWPPNNNASNKKANNPAEFFFKSRYSVASKGAGSILG